MSTLTKSPAWQALARHYETARAWHMRTLFAEDRMRFDRFSIDLGDLFVDYSKNRVTAETMRLLLALAEQQKVDRVARSHVRRREDQRHRASRRPPRRASQPSEPSDRGRRQGRDARGERRARTDARVHRPAPERSVEGVHGQAHHRRREHRHRRQRPRARHGVRGAAALLAGRASARTSSRTWTARTSSRR